METEHGFEQSEEAKEAELREILDSASKEWGSLKFYKYKYEYFKKLQTAHPDIGQYKLYHILIGSSYDRNIDMPFDLPDNEMERFIRNIPSPK